MYHKPIQLRFSLFFFVMFLLGTVCAIPTENTESDEISKLIVDQKYQTAFNALLELEAEKDQAEVIARQIRFLTDYFIQSTMHQMWILKDLEDGETIESLRNHLPVGEYQYILFDPIAVYEEFVSENGRSPVLSLALGEYYQDAILRYSDKWLLTSNEALVKTREHFQFAYENGVYTDNSLATLGDFSYELENYQEAKSFYELSLEQNPEYAHSHYQLSIMLMILSDMDQFYYHIEKAIELYEYPPYRGDAYVTAAQGALKLEDIRNAEQYLIRGHNEFSKDYRYPQNLNNIYLHQEQFEKAAIWADILFSLDSTNPNSSRIVMDNYLAHGLTDQLIDFFNRNVEKYDHIETRGNLYFHLALVYKDIGNTEGSSIALDLAEEAFISTFGKEADVILTIEAIRQSL